MTHLVAYTTVMRGGPISDLLEEAGQRGMSALAASLKHLEFEHEGQFYKFDSFDQRTDVGGSQIFDPNARRMVNMADYYYNSNRKVNTRMPPICSTGKP